MLPQRRRLRNFYPKCMYGDHVRDYYGNAHDWKSGAVVAEKSLIYSMSEGLADTFAQLSKARRKGLSV